MKDRPPVVSKHTYISRLFVGMQTCLEKLGAKPTLAQLEHWAIFIHESMSISSRNYHSVKHVFDIADGWDDPIGLLSAYFHDCIYFNVDGGLSPCQAKMLDSVVKKDADRKCIIVLETDEPLVAMVEDIFGFVPKQELSPMGGLNEFLSAVIAVRQLAPVLDRKSLAQIACCIEATIPFRASKSDEPGPMDKLFERMVAVNEKLELGMTEEELVLAVQRAALLSNRDLGNFGSEDRTWFLDNTWSLLPETNESLRHQYLYTAKEFQHAVFKMNGFFSFLQPERIFTSFRGVPSDETVETLTMQARRNMEIGRKYVGSKLLSVSLLAAFGELTGGDAPMSLFMGDLPSRQHVSCRLEDYLPPPPSQEVTNYDLDVYNILAKGRNAETSFDIRQSPLAAYLYGCMGDEGIDKCLGSVKLYPMEPDSARALLNALPKEAVLGVAENMAKVAVSRAHLIKELIAELYGDEQEENGKE
eukprot:CAMPEP_0194045486 /NCGR_PEP_ID=MMETSP0009_2-20130614/16814_1 /TAXON_ID=210454 /ORGANISM="Grammatophora oceanica, Strain CCMP 410" /LENGTH=472 /DNA_ID=CAMNT_0038690349 /DNA_START=63 /DNA_END=1481 /DNA_ORIENTATION=-